MAKTRWKAPSHQNKLAVTNLPPSQGVLKQIEAILVKESLSLNVSMCTLLKIILFKFECLTDQISTPKEVIISKEVPHQILEAPSIQKKTKRKIRVLAQEHPID